MPDLLGGSAEFERAIGIKWPRPEVYEQQLRGAAVLPLRCIACKRSVRNRDRVVATGVRGNMVAIPGLREITCEATFQDASGCVNIDLVTHDEGEHWDIRNIEFSPERSPAHRLIRVSRPEKPLDPEAARAAIANAERVFDAAEEDRVRR